MVKLGSQIFQSILPWLYDSDDHWMLQEKEREKAENERKERELREKILSVMKEKEERRLAEEREALRRRLSGQVRLRSAVVISKAFKSKPPHG